jgi:hypothetical protein
MEDKDRYHSWELCVKVLLAVSCRIFLVHGSLLALEKAYPVDWKT